MQERKLVKNRVIFTGGEKIKKEPIDVVILTYNSEKTIKQCLDAIMQNIPYHNIIIVDGGSSDGTLDIIEGHPLKKSIKLFIKPELTLGEARIFAYKQVETPIFASIDSDVIIKPGWFDEMMKFMDRNTGAVEGGVINYYPFIEATGYEKGRGYTFNNLFLKDAVKNIQAVKLLTKEDNYIKYHIEKNGFRWYKSGLVLGDHYSNPVRLEGSKIFIFRIGEKKDVLMSAGKSDRLTNNHVKVLKMFLDAWYKPLIIWKELMRKWFWHFVGWLHG